MARHERLDSLSIVIQKDEDKPGFVDYLFVADLWDKDPRSDNRLMVVGQRRGLFRIDKATLDVNLLLPMAGDAGNKRFQKAASKILSDYRTTASFPDESHFASG